MSEEKVYTSIVLPKDLMDELTAIAKEEHRDRSAQIAVLVEHEVARRRQSEQQAGQPPAQAKKER